MKKSLQIKVCGMRDPLNVDDLVNLQPDYIGFIFYPPSKRYVKDISEGSSFDFVPKNIKKTGVFVDTTKEEIEKAITEFKLSALQLHGHETSDFCKHFYQKNIETIKVFHLDDTFSFTILEPYLNSCHYFLFDTKTKGYGGSGKKFPWHILKEYPFQKKFFLSGGIGPDDALEIKNLALPQLYGVDINSNFEKEAGIKNIAQIKEFMKDLFSF